MLSQEIPSVFLCRRREGVNRGGDGEQRIFKSWGAIRILAFWRTEITYAYIIDHLNAYIIQVKNSVEAPLSLTRPLFFVFCCFIFFNVSLEELSVF